MARFDAQDLVKQYLALLTDRLSSEAAINKAVGDRQILIADPTKNSNNRETLATLKDQFDPLTGNRTPQATYGFHNPKRTQDEFIQYGVDKNSIGDWSKVAFISAIFSAGSTLAITNPTSSNSFGRGISAAQYLVANYMSANPLFKEATGYEITQENQNILSQLNNKTAELGKTVYAMQSITEKMDGRSYKIQQKIKELESRSGSTPAETEGNKQKAAILKEVREAIKYFTTNYAQNYDPRFIDKFQEMMTEIKAKDDARPKTGWFSHKSSGLIAEVLTVADRYIPLIKQANLPAQSTPLPPMPGASPVSAAAPSPSTPSPSGSPKSAGSGHRESLFHHDAKETNGVEKTAGKDSETPSPRKP